jgi:hypothetical protein
MTQTFNSSQTWSIGHTALACAACAKPLVPGQICYAALCEIAPQSTAPVPTATPTAANAPAEPAPMASAAATPAAPAAGPTNMVRVDFCEACWLAGQRPGALPTPAGDMFSYWKTVLPAANEKKKLFVDDAVLVDVFSRLADKDAPQDIRFRFVLALILMRKRILRYDGTQTPATSEAAVSPEVWDMTLRGSEKENRLPTPVQVVNPNLTPEQIGEVSVQLSQILAEEI